jgi:hypothetical protein
MSAAIVELAQLVVSLLNDPVNQAGLSQTFTATRVRIPEFDTAANPVLSVFVLGLTEGIEFNSRTTFDHQYGIRVAIYNQVANDAAVDAMDLLREQITDLLKSHRTMPLVNGQAQLASVETSPVYDPSLLDKHNTYVTVISLTYGMLR